MTSSASKCIETVALTAEMVINAFSMARQEVYELIGKTANKPNPFIKVVVNDASNLRQEGTA